MAYDYFHTGSRFAIVIYRENGAASILCFARSEAEAIRDVRFLQEGRK
jgi:hypothetical protein